jgi:ribonuclease T1
MIRAISGREASPVALCGALVRSMATMLGVVVALALGAEDAGARNPRGELAEIAASSLPREARATLQAIERGGPFPYERDGVVFGNRERLLPIRARGYYREYTVRTPGVPHRGARRIVVGRDGERYYTDDHYASFKRIRQ